MNPRVSLLLSGTLLLACSPAGHGPAPADRAPDLRERRIPPQPRRQPPPRRIARRAAPRSRPPARPVLGVSPTHWSRQRAAWAKLVQRITPLARKGTRLPTFKLRKYFRRQGTWPLPSLDASKLTAPERALLSPKGPASQKDVGGPAGRQVWVEVDDEAGRGLVNRICAQAAVCGLGCTVGPKSSLMNRDAAVRRLARLRRDHDLVLGVRSQPGAIAISVAVPPKARSTAALARAIRRATRGLTGAIRFEVTPVARLVPGLTVTGDPARVAVGSQRRLAQALCRLAARLGDGLLETWHGNRAASRRRAKALAAWLGLTFVDKPVHAKRPKLEHRYIRRHYRDRVFNWQRRADGAYLIRPAMVVLHHTGGLSLRSALYTLTSLRLGSRAGLTRPTSLSVGVPYLVARSGRVYRLFTDDDRFGRHTIGLNHSAIGVENVGTKRSGFTAAQIESNVRLVQYLAMRYPLRYLIGHREVYQMARTPYYLEAVPKYCSNKNDPTWRALRLIRKRAQPLGLVGPPTTRPVLKGCRDMRRYFKRRRAARRRAR